MEGPCGLEGRCRGETSLRVASIRGQVQNGVSSEEAVVIPTGPAFFSYDGGSHWTPQVDEMYGLDVLGAFAKTFQGQVSGFCLG